MATAWKKAEAKQVKYIQPNNVIGLQLNDEVVSSTAWNPKNNTLTIGTKSGKVFKWDSASGKTKCLFQCPDEVYKIDWNHDGSFLATITQVKTVMNWQCYEVLVWGATEKSLKKMTQTIEIGVSSQCIMNWNSSGNLFTTLTNGKGNLKD